MAGRLHLIRSVVVGGFAIHGAMSACGHVDSMAVDARAAEPPSSDTSIPPGTIVAFSGTTAPDGWALCDGSTVSRATYAALFAATGIHFGSGDGITTFNLPDLRGRFLRGTDSGTGRDPDATTRTASSTGGSTGDAVGSLQVAATALPRTPFVTENAGSHTHASGAFDRLLQHTGQNTTGTVDSTDLSGSEPDITSSQPLLAAGAHIHRLGGAFGSGGDKETRPANISVNYLIKL